MAGIRASRSAVRRWLAVAGFAVAISAIAAASLVLPGRHPPVRHLSSRSSGRGIAFPPWKELFDDPLYGDGKVTTVESAKKAVPFPIFIPSHPMANRANLRGTFISKNVSPDATIVMTFGSDVIVWLERFVYPDAVGWYNERIRDGSPRHLDLVGTVPALVIQGDSIRPTVIEFVLGDNSPTVVDGVHVKVYGHNLDIEAVKQIAATVQPA